MKTSGIDDKLRERLLLGRRIEGDRLLLADGVLRAALDGSRPLTAGERAALQGSPLTQRRLAALAQQARASGRARWQASPGMLRAADGGGALELLETDDGCWRLHFVGDGAGWRVVLQLLPGAPFAASLLARAPHLAVLDGAGGQVLRGRLDADGECEAAWPFKEAPRAHFQRHGARFRVQSAG